MVWINGFVFWLRLFVWYLRVCCDLVLGYMCLGCSFWCGVSASRFLFDCIVMLELLGFICSLGGLGGLVLWILSCFGICCVGGVWCLKIV